MKDADRTGRILAAADQLIASDDLLEAIEFLRRESLLSAISENELIVLAARTNRVKRERRQGLLLPQDYQLEMTKISWALTELLLPLRERIQITNSTMSQNAVSNKNNASSERQIDLLLCTALTEEAQVVSAVLDLVATVLPIQLDIGADTSCRIRLYGFRVEGGRVCRVATASAHHMGAVGMGVFAAPLLARIRPRSAALIGIAAAVDTSAVVLGDVPFASQVLSYDDIAVEKGALTFRSDGFQVDPAMRAAAGELRTSIASYRPWQDACLASIGDVVKILNQLRSTIMTPQNLTTSPHLVVNVSAGGPFLLRDKDFRESLRKSPENTPLRGIKVAHPLHPKLVSAEMEAHGFMRAAHEYGVPASVLKGISDVGDADKAQLERESNGFFRAYACSNATLAALHILRSRSVTEPMLGRTVPL